jgi:hypothetical protein
VESIDHIKGPDLEPPATKIEKLERFAETMIAKVSS